MTKKISELNALAIADLAAGDVIPIVDASAGETKKIDLHALRGNAVLQVVQAETSTEVTVSSTTYTDTTLTATITPRSTTSKIFVIVNQSVYFSTSSYFAGGGLRIERSIGGGGFSTVFASVQDADGPYDYYTHSVGSGATSTDLGLRAAITVLDSPATASAVTYKTQIRPYTPADSGTAKAQSATSPTTARSFITLMEIAG